MKLCSYSQTLLLREPASAYVHLLCPSECPYWALAKTLVKEAKPTHRHRLKVGQFLEKTKDRKKIAKKRLLLLYVYT